MKVGAKLLAGNPVNLCEMDHATFLFLLQMLKMSRCRAVTTMETTHIRTVHSMSHAALLERLQKTLGDEAQMDVLTGGLRGR